MKKLVKSFANIGMGILCLFFTKCTQEKPLINPPLTDVAVKTEKVKIKNNEGAELEFDQGTKVIIPENVFVDENNSVIEGKVDLEFSQYKTVEDIILSGIPMIYDSGNVSGIFQSAGMFNIQGTYKGKPVFIAEGKEISIEMLSKQKDENFNAYYLNEKTKKWEYINTSLITKTVYIESDTIEMLIKIEKPIEPYQPKSEDILLDFDINYELYPELASFKGVLWVLDKSCYHLSNKLKYGNFENIILDRIPNTNSFRISLHKLTDNGSEPLVIKATPALTGQNFDTAMNHYQKALVEYKEALMEKERLRIIKENNANFARRLNISSLGTYNWDRLYKTPSSITLAPTFALKGNPQVKEEEMKIYYLAQDISVEITEYNKSIIPFNLEDDIKLIALLPEGKIATYSTLETRNTIKNYINKEQKKQPVIRLNPQEETITSTYDLKKVISSL